MFARMRHAISHLLSGRYGHPLHEVMLKGTYPWNDFRSFFVEQDFLYLSDFVEALRIVSNRLPQKEHARAFKKFSEDNLDYQRDIHNKYLRESPSLKLFPSKLPAKKSPIMSSYGQHLLVTAEFFPVQEAVGSLLPCHCLYNEFGKKMLNAPGFNIHNPYHAWISAYASEGFTASTQLIIQIAEELGNAVTCPVKQKNMISAFVKSTEYEISFWDSVYKRNSNRLVVHKDTGSPLARRDDAGIKKSDFKPAFSFGR